ASGILYRLRGLFEPSCILVSTTVLTLRPTGLLPLVTDNLPTRLLADDMMEGSVVNTRSINLGSASQPGINGATWDLHRTDIQAQQGTWERWTVRADTPQAFYIQGAKFLVKSVNNAPPMVEDRGWKDTVWVDGEVSLMVYFPQASSEHFPFIYYSQTLELATRGSVGQLVVNAAQ
ncbi:MAG: multicopper oxidase domain-containing protein, partial [Hafniaceae bacterium]|nr:multicopper oxidase domain-containing protein [Hafniaceae bacterium]